MISKSDKAISDKDSVSANLLSLISHEIRTPMNGIIGFSELLQKPQLSGSNQKKYIDIILKSSKRMLGIINDLIDISLIEAGQIKLNKVQTYVNIIINDLFTFFKQDADKKGIKLIHKNELPLKNSIIEADTRRVFQILSNLINNAIKFTSTGQIHLVIIKNLQPLSFMCKIQVLASLLN